MGLHMRELVGCPRPLLVSILEQPLPILEMFEVLNEKLAGKERAEMYGTVVEKSIKEVKAKNPPSEKRPNGGGGPAVAPIAPPPTRVPYLAGFDHPNSGTQGNARSVATEIIYPFITQEQRELARQARQGASSSAQVGAPRNTQGGGSEHPKQHPRPPRPQNGRAGPAPAPARGGGPVTRPEGAQTLGGGPQVLADF